MAILPSNIIIWIILLAPGFIAVITATTLSALERTLPSYYLIFSSLVSSLFIDVIFIWLYDIIGNEPIQLFENSKSVLFQPNFNVEIFMLIFFLSILLGIVYAIGIIYGFTSRFRRQLWRLRDVTSHSGQPWQSFLKESAQIRVKTSDSELYTGIPTRWNSDWRERELVLAHPHRYNSDNHEYEEAGGDKMFFTSDDIERVLQQQTRQD